MTSKKFLVKVPNNIELIYCNIQKILLIKNAKKTQIIKLVTKLIIQNNVIKVTKLPFIKNSNIEKRKIKCYQGTCTFLIKQNFFELMYKFCKKLKLTGVGFKIIPIKFLNYTVFQLKLGFSHSIYFKTSEDIKINCYKSTKMFIFGNNYQKITKIASLLKSYKTPDPYKNKGIQYSNEKLILKKGKKV